VCSSDLTIFNICQNGTSKHALMQEDRAA